MDCKMSKLSDPFGTFHEADRLLGISIDLLVLRSIAAGTMRVSHSGHEAKVICPLLRQRPSQSGMI